MGKNPSRFSESNVAVDSKYAKDSVKGLDTKQFPVEFVSWEEAQAYCKKMQDNDIQKRKFRLPSEAEWEYACRAGTTTAFFFGNDEKDCADYAWLGENSKGRTHQVWTKKPNPWGLYDMHGNVWQWCEDYYGPYDELPQKDPLRSAEYSELYSGHVLRGGCFMNPWYITSAQKIINWIQGQRHTERRGVGNSSQCEPANGTTSAARAAFANATLPCYRATTPRGHYPSGRC